MFYAASSFNEHLYFDTQNVKDMSAMFSYASKFEQPLDFDLRNVRDAGGMFFSTAIERRFGITTLKDIPPDHPYFQWCQSLSEFFEHRHKHRRDQHGSR
jgi:hypothetical protein